DTSDWFDEEQGPARLTAPGITSAARYKATDEEKPDWLAIHNLASPEVLKSPSYLALRDEASDNEKSIISRIPILQHRTYSLIQEFSRPDLPSDALPGKYILAAIWSISKEMDAEFHRWYEEEHNADVATVPMWLRTRRYRMVDGADIVGKGPSLEGFDYLVLHEWNQDGYLETPEFIRLSNTAWTLKIVGNARGLMARPFVLHKHLKK
ncbi:hypothetical protein AN958_00756, partial [Leucoagaricus sp. SymC.cos]